MKSLMWMFVAMAVYGFFTPHKGAALMSIGMAAFMLYASRHYDKQEQQWLRDPRNAEQPPPTTEMLKKHDCEHS